ncbi:RING-H2 finger protein atl74 [Phtheirospermum japonicum]|uniref:RING-H2 finger protein atl74 n=1 Tax=Phtheirospermum japonicum TaxID=374723 RepID=A0A830CA61_9LAMI|nr:RING-H2 finger protein atl74 [Phtheirospermum japonicum]
MDDSMIPRYELKPGIKFVFESRTKFVVKRIDGDERIDSEKLETGAEEGITEYQLYMSLRQRLEEYWMPTDEIRDLARKALAFAKEKEADPRHASLRFIPVAIELDVCTVQEVGEPIGAVFDRAIRAQHLFPASLIRCKNLEDGEEDEFLCFLRGKMPTHRVEDVNDALRYMEVCPLCSRKPAVGARIAWFDDCKHSFHYHCIIAWLLEKKSCPNCRHQISY